MLYFNFIFKCRLNRAISQNHTTQWSRFFSVLKLENWIMKSSPEIAWMSVFYSHKTCILSFFLQFIFIYLKVLLFLYGMGHLNACGSWLSTYTSGLSSVCSFHTLNWNYKYTQWGKKKNRVWQAIGTDKSGLNENPLSIETNIFWSK